MTTVANPSPRGLVTRSFSGIMRGKFVGLIWDDHSHLRSRGDSQRNVKAATGVPKEPGIGHTNVAVSLPRGRARWNGRQSLNGCRCCSASREQGGCVHGTDARSFSHAEDVSLGERQMKTYREVRRTSCPSRSFDGLEVRRTVKLHLPLALPAAADFLSECFG